MFNIFSNTARTESQWDSDDPLQSPDSAAQPKSTGGRMAPEPRPRAKTPPGAQKTKPAESRQYTAGVKEGLNADDDDDDDNWDEIR
jgi:hypothetical protein